MLEVQNNYFNIRYRLAASIVFDTHSHVGIIEDDLN